MDARRAVRRHIEARVALTLTAAFSEAIGWALLLRSTGCHTAFTVHSGLETVLALTGRAVRVGAAVGWA